VFKTTQGKLTVQRRQL